MKINLSIDVDDKLVSNRNDISSLIKLVSCDIEQGSSSGFIRDNSTGNESNRWSLQVAKTK
jgi:hypothetical protein